MAETEKSKDNEHNYVADAQNWEARVKGELESARCWEANWGELYHEKSEGNDGSGGKDRIKHLEKQIQELPFTGAMTTHRMSYTIDNCTPYEQTKHRRNTGALQKSSASVDELADFEETGSIGEGSRRPEP